LKDNLFQGENYGEAQSFVPTRNNLKDNLFQGENYGEAQSLRGN